MKHDKIVSSVKNKLNAIETLISNDLTNSNISHDEFVSVQNVLKEYDDVKEEIKIIIINMFDVIRQILYLLYYHNKITKNFTTV